jgi:hypothetical protein
VGFKMFKVQAFIQGHDETRFIYELKTYQETFAKVNLLKRLNGLDLIEAWHVGGRDFRLNVTFSRKERGGTWQVEDNSLPIDYEKYLPVPVR